MGHKNPAPTYSLSARGPVSGVQRRPPSCAAKRESLLIVDDGERSRNLLSRRLRQLGYDVTTADSGERALALIEQRAFDAIMLDVIMPGMGGLEVLEQVRRTRAAAALPIIMTTALDQSDDVVCALRLGANDYVVKPFDLEVVCARLGTHLSLKRSMEQVARLADELEVRSRFIQKTFGRYLSDDIVATLLASPDGRGLGGERRNVAILMCDLRGFTLLTDGMPPERVMALLNNYLGVMAGIITQHGGMIDEFIGDGILAVFGAPIERDDDPQRAAFCALDMQRAMALVNEKNSAEGLPTLEMGIALHAGCVVVGNIGSEARAKYGVVGSHVTLTARIESSTVGGQILISEALRSALDIEPRLGAAMSIVAKGLKEPIVVHELLGAAADVDSPLAEQTPCCTALHTVLPVEMWRVTDKHVDAGALGGAITALSLTSCEICAVFRPEALENLRLRVGEDPSGGEIYGKVMSHDDKMSDRFRVRFTAITPGTTTMLREILRSQVG